MAVSRTPDKLAVETFSDGLRGDLLYPGDAGYDEARTVWNGMVEKHPSMVVRCRGASDVVRAVDFARENDVPFAVKGGGHSVAGHSTIEDGLLIDLSAMADVRVDPVRKRATVGAGATLGDLDHETQAFGLATTMGVASPTGVAGLTLGGGNGHLSRAFGLACDNLVSADVVTADGELVHASEEENEELFWAIRGGGGNFGIVTTLEFQLHDLGPEVLAGPIFHELADARDVLREVRDVMADAPDEVSCIVGVLTLPPDEMFPADAQGQPALYLVPCYAGSVEDAESELAALRAIGSPIVDGVAPIPYVALQSMFDEGNPAGNRYYWKSEFMDELPDDAIDALLDYLDENPLPSPFTTISIEILGGAVARVDPEATAYPHREAMYDFGVWGNWTDPADDEPMTEWVRGCHRAISPYASGGFYVNYLDSDEDDRVRAAFGQNFERLAEIKARWDPENLFRKNKNVTPRA